MAGYPLIDLVSGLEIPRRGTFSVVSPRKPQGQIASSSSIGKPATPSGGSSSASSVVGNFVEVAESRTYHTTERHVYSSDGLFSLVYKNIKSLSMTTAQGTSSFVYQDIEDITELDDDE
jgi:hypothetical protein